MKRILFIVLLLSNGLWAQKQLGYELSGTLNIQVGNEIVHPANVLVELEGENKTATTDAKGNYCFENLESKNYNLRVFGYTYKPKSFSVQLNSESIQNFDLKLKAECLANGEVAKNDLKIGQPRLLIKGGIAPVIETGQAEFEKKYDVVYSDFGCMQDPFECLQQYNEVIFKYLDDLYGNAWRKSVRKDVIGFQKV